MHMKVQNIVKNKPYLIWYTKDYDGLSDAAVVEAVLNYGDMDDVRKLIKVLGARRVAKIFREKSSMPRSNYDPKMRHFFNLYFSKHARRNSH